MLFELEERKDTYREAIKASKESVDELRNYKEKIVKKEAQEFILIDGVVKSVGMCLQQSRNQFILHFVNMSY